MRRINDFKIRTRIFILTCLIMLSIIASVAVISYSLSSGALRKQVSFTVDQQLGYAARVLDQEFQSSVGLMNTFFINLQLKDVITSYLADSAVPGINITTLRIGATEKLRRHMQNIIPSYENKPTVTAYMSDGYGTWSVDTLKGCRLALPDWEMRWYREISEAKNVQYRYGVSWAVSIDGREYQSYEVSSVIKHKNDVDRIAVIKINRELGGMFKMACGTLDLTGGTVLFLDGGGETLYAAGNLVENFTGRPAGEQTWDHTSGLAVSIADKPGSNGEISVGGRRFFVFARSYAQMGWRIVYIADRGVFMADSIGLGQVFLAISFAMSLFAVSLLLITSRRVTSGLARLTRAVQCLDADDLALNFHSSHGDEVGVLSSAFDRVLGAIRDTMRQKEDMQREKYAMEFQALNAQINPHFLNNTLSAIAAMAEEIEAYDISASLVSLAKFYRLSLGSGAEIITVGEEIELIKCYIYICGLRFKDKLTIAFDADGDVGGCPTPKLIVQPLIENAIMHAFRDKDSEMNRVEVSIFRDGGDIVYRVADNGVGMDAEAVDIVLSGGGSESYRAIVNIDRRVKLHFGDSYGVRISSQPSVGTTVTVVIPGR